MHDRDTSSAADSLPQLAAVPCLSDSLWRRWYAKLYWAGVMTYWSAFLVSWQLHVFFGFFRSAAGGYLGLLFHPMTALVILGFGYVWAVFSVVHWDGDAGEADHLFPKKSVGGLSNPYADPLDPRSGMNWIGSPSKQAEQFGDIWP